jgi:hypothetical protein
MVRRASRKAAKPGRKTMVADPYNMCFTLGDRSAVSGKHLWLSGRWDDEVYRIDTRGEVRNICVGLKR